MTKISDPLIWHMLGQISRKNIQKIGEIASYSKIEVWKMPYLRAFPDLANFVMGE